MATTKNPGRQELSDMTKEELMEHAQRLDISGRSQMNKEDLIEAISGAGSSGSNRGSSNTSATNSRNSNRGGVSNRERDENGQFVSKS